MSNLSNLKKSIEYQLTLKKMWNGGGMGWGAFSCYKKTNDVSIQQMTWALFNIQPTLNRLFNNCLMSFWYIDID